MRMDAEEITTRVLDSREGQSSADSKAQAALQGLACYLWGRPESEDSRFARASFRLPGRAERTAALVWPHHTGARWEWHALLRLSDGTEVAGASSETVDELMHLWVAWMCVDAKSGRLTAAQRLELLDAADWMRSTPAAERLGVCFDDVDSIRLVGA